MPLPLRLALGACAPPRALLFGALQLAAAGVAMTASAAPPHTGAGYATASFDVLVYGATPGGVAAAVAAGREGARVGLLEPGLYVGGAMSGGLGQADYGPHARRIMGEASLSTEFFKRVAQHYGAPFFWPVTTHDSRFNLSRSTQAPAPPRAATRPLLVSNPRSGGASRPRLMASPPHMPAGAPGRASSAPWGEAGGGGRERGGR